MVTDESGLLIGMTSFQVDVRENCTGLGALTSIRKYKRWITKHANLETNETGSKFDKVTLLCGPIVVIYLNTGGG